MKINWKSSKKLSLPLNIVIFNLCKMWPFRNHKIWIFGASKGNKYEDNSRYMFEYVCNHPENEIHAVWLCNEQSVMDRVNADGHDACLNSSIRGKWFQLRAGVAVYTHGLNDFGTFPFNYIDEFEDGFKRIYNGKYYGLNLKVKRILDHFFSWTYRDITPVTSQYACEWSRKMFTLNESGLKITGYPRNDAFKYVKRDKILELLHIDKTKKIIIYMPTYRQQSLGENAMNDIVKELYYCEELGVFLRENNYIFLVKPHPLTPHIELMKRVDFIVIDHQAVEDNQQLMAVADILVTDYSSCFVDYALLNRPIVFYTPDDEIFLKKSEQMEPEYFEISALCKASSPQELISCLRKPNMKLVERTNTIFEDDNICGTCYSENVYNEICKEIGL